MIKLELTYEQLYSLYGNGEHEVACDVTDEIYVKTPDGFSKVHKVVTKHNHDIIKVEFDDGDGFECSTNHLFQDYSTGLSVKAIDSEIVNSIYGKKKVLEKIPMGTENVYDISIDSPHWYIAKESSGLIHHNSYILLGMVKNFLDSYEDSYVFFFESEYALSKKDFVRRGIDTTRINFNRVDTIEIFKDKSYKSVKYFLDSFPEPEDRPKVMVCLDSLGYLSTSKELKDVESGKDTADMTRSRAIRSAFRVLLGLLGKNNIPFVLTTHVYDTMSPFSPTAINGGKAVYYASTLILNLRKSLNREGKEVVGSIIKMTTEKSRLTKEKQTVETVINFNGGLDRYHGMVDLAIESGALEYNGRQFIIDGKKVWGKAIAKDPEQYFTKEVLDKIDKYCMQKYLYDEELDYEPDQQEDS